MLPAGRASDPGSSSQDSIHNSCLDDTGQFFFESVVHNKQLLMAQTEEVQDRGVPVGNADSVFDGMQADFIRGTPGCSGLDSGSGHSCAEGVLVVVSSGFSSVFIRRQLLSN